MFFDCTAQCLREQYSVSGEIWMEENAKNEK